MLNKPVYTVTADNIANGPMYVVLENPGINALPNLGNFQLHNLTNLKY